MQKFSSNVVEKLIECIIKDTENSSYMSNRKRIINEFFKPLKIIGLVKNKYGLFVTQKIVKIMSKEEKIEIKAYLKEKISITSTKEKQYLQNLFDHLI
jgi:hypothetical protein